MSTIISFINYCWNFNSNFLPLVISFPISCVGSGDGSGVGTLSKFFIGKNLPLKLLRTFSLAPRINPQLFQKKNPFSFVCFI